MVIQIILGGVLLVAISGTLFINFYPSIGGSQSAEKIEIFKKSGHYKDDVFVNQIPTSMDMGFGKFMTVLKDSTIYSSDYLYFSTSNTLSYNKKNPYTHPLKIIDGKNGSLRAREIIQFIYHANRNIISNNYYWSM